MGRGEKAIEGIVVDEVTGEIRETSEAKAAGLAALKEAMEVAVAKSKVDAAKSSKVVELRFPRTDDAFLLAFLRSRKYKISAALAVLVSFSNFWYGNRDLIDGLCAEKVRKIYALGMMQFLPGTDVHGNAVTALRMAAMDYSKFTPKEMIQLSIYIMCHLFGNESMQTHGAAYVESMENFSMMHSMAMSRGLSKEDNKVMMSVGMDTFPMRIRSIYLVHQPRWFSVFWAVVRVFLKEKLRKRLVVLGTDFKALHAIVPAENLPADFGGTCTDPPSKFLDDMEALERSHGCIGGFAMPMSVDDPMGLLKQGAKGGALHWQEGGAAGAGDTPSLPPTVDSSEQAAATGAAVHWNSSSPSAGMAMGL